MRSTSRLGKFGLVISLSVIALAFWFTFAIAQSPNQEQVESGAQLFAENCAVCHGLDGEGRIGATLAKDWPSIRPDLQVRATIENGIPGTLMPAWSQANGGPLASEEIDALVAFILSWETGGPRQIPPTLTPFPRPAMSPIPGVSGDPNRGAGLFDQNCVVCHGANGEGRIGANLAKAWSSVRPDLQVKATISNGIEGTLMPAWSQENGGPLNEADINDLTAFVVGISETVAPAQPTATPEPALNSFLTGWGGVIIFLVLAGVVIGVILLVQNRRE